MPNLAACVHCSDERSVRGCHRHQTVNAATSHSNWTIGATHKSQRETRYTIGAAASSDGYFTCLFRIDFKYHHFLLVSSVVTSNVTSQRRIAVIWGIMQTHSTRQTCAICEAHGLGHPLLRRCSEFDALADSFIGWLSLSSHGVR